MEQLPTPTQEESLEEFIKTIDKNSEGWDAVVEYRDALYRRFFSISTTDNEYRIDQNEFEEALGHAVEMVIGRFQPENFISANNARMILLSGISHEWEKRASKVEANIESAVHAIDLAKGSLVEQPGTVALQPEQTV